MDLDLDDHDEHGLVIYMFPDGTVDADPCCGCALCDCPEHAS